MPPRPICRNPLLTLDGPPPTTAGAFPEISRAVYLARRSDLSRFASFSVDHGHRMEGGAQDIDWLRCFSLLSRASATGLYSWSPY